ncbi:MAG: hypothetical protein WCG27_12780, partial [Pseudomonadota bacterium]
AIKRWQETKSNLWLLPAMTLSDGKNPASVALDRATEKITKNSPGWGHLITHRARHLIERGETKEAAQVLSQIDVNATHGHWSSNNQLRGLQLTVAENLNDFVHFAPRSAFVSSEFEWDKDIYVEKGPSDYTPKFLDTDGAWVINNNLPLNTLMELIENEQFPKDLSRQVSAAGWARAVILKRKKLGNYFAQKLSILAPEMRPLLQSYLTDDKPEESFRSGIFAILHAPTITPFIGNGYQHTKLYTKEEGYGDNWWGAKSNDQKTPDCYNGNAHLTWEPPKNIMGQELLFSLEIPWEKWTFPPIQTRETAGQEMKLIKSTGASSVFMGNTILEWAKKSPDDPRIPEALHLFVKMTRNTCNSDKVSMLSMTAFRLLHKKYAQTEWAQKTKIHF